MKLIFKTDIGSVTLSGKKDADIVIKSISGLGVLEKNYEYICYYGMDGKTTLGSYFHSRIITLSCDIYNSNKLLIKQIMKTLYREGMLMVMNSHLQRCIKYKPLSFEFGEKHGPIQSFAFQIECDNPYFTDIFYTKKDIYSRSKNITSPFTLPAVFSSRTYKSIIINNGDAPIYPKILIKPTSSADASGVYTLTNLTTGNKITLNLSISNEEIITVDVEERTITSSIKGNIINSLSDGAMSNFYLATGKNEIEFACSNISVAPHSTLMYRNNYMEAL